jgi:CysZ protein
MNPIARFLQGINFFFSGLGMLARYPSLFGLALIPIALTVIVLLGLALGAAWLLGQGLQESAMVAADGRLLLQAIAFLLVLFVAYLIYLPLTRIFLAPFSEKLSHKTSQLSGMTSLTERELGFFTSIWEGVKLVVVQIVIVVLVLLLTLVLPPVGVPLGIFITICFCGVDFLDVPLSLRGMSLRQKVDLLWRSRALVLGFAVAGYVLLHVPLLNLLALPVGVIGATRLVNQVVSESSGDWIG